MTLKSCLYTVCLILLSSWTLAQSGGFADRDQRRNENNWRRPITVIGQVVTTDQSKIEVPVRVLLICSGSVRQQTVTAADGGFTLELEDGNASNVDESGITRNPFDDSLQQGNAQRGLGRVDLSNCEVRAEAAGFRSETIRLGIRDELDDFDIGALTVERLEGVKGGTVSVKSLAAPKDAKESLEKARKALAGKDPDLEKARKELEKAIQEYPEYAEAWLLLGQVKKAQGQVEPARADFERAIELDPTFTPPYMALCQTSLQLSDWARAARAAEEVLAINPYLDQAYYYQGMANYYLNNLELAQQSLLSFQERKEEPFPPATYLLGLTFATQGDYEEARIHFEEFLKLSPESPLAEQLEQKLNEWTQAGLIP